MDPIVWSVERRKWLCYDDRLIDIVLESDRFVVPTYDYAALEEKLARKFEFTKRVIGNMPLANEGAAHLQLREKMSSDINAKLKEAIAAFDDNFGTRISAQAAAPSGVIDIAVPVMKSILESNRVFTGIELEHDTDYSSLTLMLDDSQSIKSRVAREEFIKSIILRNPDDGFYKIALLSIGVNALIGSTLHSLIKILTNHGFATLLGTQHFASNAIKHLDRACIDDAVVGDRVIRRGDNVRLYVAGYERANLQGAQLNKKFFGMGSSHSCPGMKYSLSVWRAAVQVISTNFRDLRLVDFGYRPNDGIFNFPTRVVLEYTR